MCDSTDPSGDLTCAFAEALETMAFITPGPGRVPFRAPPDGVRVRVGFTGPSAGAVELIADRALGRTLVENTTASAPAADADPDDALKELVNVACGLFLRRRPAAGAFELSVPTVTPAGATPPAATATVLDLDGHDVAIHLVDTAEHLTEAAPC